MLSRKKKIGGNIKSSFLALIPKEPNPTTFNIYRPISLSNSSYKILTKILANRMKNLLPENNFREQRKICPQEENHIQCDNCTGGYPQQFPKKGKWNDFEFRYG